MTNMDAIILKNISKKYSISCNRPILFKNIFMSEKKEEVWALKNISLTIKKGETMGIIGENGSGKSTLLKIIAGITIPTKGSIEVNGRVGSLIELGAGFHPDLTGRENIYLNGTLLGFTKKELDKKYDEIVGFAGIGEYINQRIRTYSSGMTVRLGFSVAVHLDPDILLIDEVLAVGDEDFQRKCVEKMQIFRKKDVTIIFVSHNLSLINSVTNRVLMLNKGRIIKQGIPEDVIKSYQQLFTARSIGNKTSTYNKGKYIAKVKFYNEKGEEKETFEIGETFIARIFYNAEIQVKQPVFGVAFHTSYGFVIAGPNTYSTGFKTPSLKGKGWVDCLITKLPLLPGRYGFTAAIFDSSCSVPYDYHNQIYSFQVVGNSKHQTGNFQIPVTWRIHE